MNTHLKDQLQLHASSDSYPFHMPGHKRRAGGASLIDITEIDGFDNLHGAEGILAREMERAAAFYNTRSTHILVNGSTCGLLAAVSAAVPRGGRILIERSAHIAVYHAAYLRGLSLSYITAASPGQNHPDTPVSAVLLTSPSYEGCVKDVAAWADYAHSLGAVLIVDEAHGAHFSMHPAFPVSAVRLGADLVVQSTHKTLTSLTQTALLHRVTDRVSDEALEKFLRIYESSSPSYVLMSSVTEAVRACIEGGPALFEPYVRRLYALRAALSDLRHLHLACGTSCRVSCDGGLPGAAAGSLQDPGKLVIKTGDSGLTGAELYDLLRINYRLQPEMKAPDYVLLMTSYMDTQEGFDRLIRALHEIDGTCSSEAACCRPGRADGSTLGSERNNTPADHSALGSERDHTPAGHSALSPGRSCDPVAPTGTRPSSVHSAGSASPLLPPVRLPLAEAYDAPSEFVPLEEAEGRTASGFLIVYPPDSPLLVPGEVFTRDAIEAVRAVPAAGLTLSGAEQKNGQLFVPCVREDWLSVFPALRP